MDAKVPKVPAKPPFQPFPKLPRLNRGMVITEKIDGTNACVIVTDDGEVVAQSRKRLISPEQDNFGFAAWVAEHADELRHLGPGYHFGEWWGLGIQRGYDQDRKHFSLFNTGRWEDPVRADNRSAKAAAPPCCRVVPILATGNFSQQKINEALTRLRSEGSAAAPGFMEPEGIVVYLSAARTSFKVTLKNDQLPKALAEKVAA